MSNLDASDHAGRDSTRIPAAFSSSPTLRRPQPSRRRRDRRCVRHRERAGGGDAAPARGPGGELRLRRGLTSCTLTNAYVQDVRQRPSTSCVVTRADGPVAIHGRLGWAPPCAGAWSPRRCWRPRLRARRRLVARREQAPPRTPIGREVAVPRHLEDDEEFRMPLPELIEHGRRLFAANWTEQEGGGRPLMKGTGKELTDPSKPLVGARAFNRISAPDANSCAGCHNAPYGIARRRRRLRHQRLRARPAVRLRDVRADDRDADAERRSTKAGSRSTSTPWATRGRPPGCSAPATSRCWRARSPTICTRSATA